MVPIAQYENLNFQEIFKLLSSYCITHPGYWRQNNEDSYYANDSQRLWIVCDGMGGHQEGNYASRLVTDIFEKIPLSLDFEENIEVIQSQIFNIHLLLQKKAHQLGPDAIIGTTVVILLIDAYRGACFHAGDSRCYLLRNSILSFVTTDHATTIETSSGERRVLTNALSAPNTYFLETKKFKVENGDIFLLCSDGLYETRTNEEILHAMSNPSLSQGIDRLVALVLQDGAHDNLTAIAIKVSQ